MAHINEPMQQKFLSYIEQKGLFSVENDKILIAVSGGADSVTMAHLFYKAGIKAAIAHCNFQLRGNESDGDERFVKELAEQYKMPYFVMHFNTKEYAGLQKLNIQLAARQLRYNWFENLRKLHNYNYIAIAHNADDAIETFFINLLRGSGIQGLTGIKPMNGFIVRPLLFAFRNEIEEYCNINNLEFRTDSSNLSDKYMRNRIRHHLVPLIKELNPEFKSVMMSNFSHLNDAEKIYQDYIAKAISEITEVKSDGLTYISINNLKASITPETVLFTALKKYNFSPKTTSEIFDNLDGESGSIYLSGSYRIIKDREFLIITPLENTWMKNHFYIDEDLTEMNEPIHLKIEKLNCECYEIPKQQNICAIDAETLSFPLILRHWQNGDYFQPIGMNGMKKVSDFFIDLKLSVAEKENAWILTSGGKIVWIVGTRPDDHFKITNRTKNIIQITLMR